MYSDGRTWIIFLCSTELYGCELDNTGLIVRIYQLSGSAS